MNAKPSSRLKFDTERLRTGPIHAEVNEPPEVLELVDDPEYTFEEPVTGALMIRLVGSSTVLVSGTVRTIAKSPCARCLEPIRVPLTAKVELTFMTDERLRDPDRYPELANDTTYWYDGESIYPADALRELLLLELPNIAACELEPNDFCPIQNRSIGPRVFGPEIVEEDEEDDNSLRAQLEKLRKKG